MIWERGYIGINKRCSQNNIFLGAKCLVSFSGWGLGGGGGVLFVCLSVYLLAEW